MPVPSRRSRPDAQRHRRACRKPDAAELEPLRGDAVAELVRTFKSQDFLDLGLDHVRVFDQPFFLRRICRQRHQPVADQVGGGLVSGVEQEDAIVQQFLFLYGETGGQASHTAATVDLVGVARSCGIADARAISTMAEIETFGRSMQDLSGPRFASIKIDSVSSACSPAATAASP